jgi:hypothetical protein
LAKAAAPNTRSDGTSSPGVPEIELREYREVILKVGPNRAQIRGLSPNELVERAEIKMAMTAHPKNLMALAAWAELLCRYRGWLKAFGPGTMVQEPSWGVLAYHIPVKSMKITSETMAEVAVDLVKQNDWGEGAKIQYIGWLTRPGIRAEVSLLIEFTSPVEANRAIITGVEWGKQIHNAVRFGREGRT